MVYELNKFNRGSDHSSIYVEVDRKNLVGKTKKQSPGRYARRTGYKPLSFRSISFDSLFKKDEFVINVPVGDYICTIAFKGLMEQIRYVLKHQPKPNFTLQTVIKAISRAIDAEDILVDCTCPDFIYRFAYWATKYGYKYGKPENRPTKITNPNDKLGSMCKHLMSLLANKKWLVKVASVINEFAKAYPDDFLDYLDMDDEVVINTPGKKRRDRNLKKTTVLPDKDPEELEPTDPDEENTEDNESEFSNKDDEKEFSNTDDSDEELEVNDEETDEDD